ncbi:rubrerythrin-like domain-containing protein [Halomarina litorea]|nr:rubrerythrin-like domain-containing protein [Halomarina sp. BCD28]
MKAETSQRGLYECLDCGRRVESLEGSRLCSKCGGYLMDISVPRHQ